MQAPVPASLRPRDWWDDLLDSGNGGDEILPEQIMLRVVAYDIADPRRLARIASVCEDFGVRVQKSVFECWLDHERMERMLTRLEAELDLKTDQVIIYSLEADSTARRKVLGEGAALTEAPRDLLIF